MGARRGLRVELNGPHPLGAVTDSGHRAVVQMPVGDFEIRGKPLLADGIAVILRGDENASRSEILNGLVGPAMTELQLERRGTEGE